MAIIETIISKPGMQESNKTVNVYQLCIFYYGSYEARLGNGPYNL